MHEVSRRRKLFQLHHENVSREYTLVEAVHDGFRRYEVTKVVRTELKFWPLPKRFKARGLLEVENETS